jgi:hypothetical protein
MSKKNKKKGFNKKELNLSAILSNSEKSVSSFGLGADFQDGRGTGAFKMGSRKRIFQKEALYVSR